MSFYRKTGILCAGTSWARVQTENHQSKTPNPRRETLMKYDISNRTGLLIAAGFLALNATSHLAHAGQGPQPSICTRSCWGARSSSCGTMNSSLNRAIVHHTAGAGDYTTDFEVGKAKVRGVQNLHKDGNGWCDIGYHFLVNGGGHIYEGRVGSMTSLVRGAHDGNNLNSFGFNVLGYYHPPYSHPFTSAARSGLEAVIAWRMPSSWSPYGSGSYNGNTVGFLDGHYKVKATACPGDGIIPSLQGIRDGVNSRKNGGGTGPASMDICSRDVNLLDAFGRGTDDAIYHMYWNGSAWSSWGSLGGGFSSGPSAVSWDSGRIDVFARGYDNAIWSKNWTWAGWSGWYSIGGVSAGAPDVASWGPNRLDVFIRGTDNALWHKCWMGNAWSQWISLGGVLASDPSAVSWGDNRIDVFARGTNGELWHLPWDGTAWGIWTSLGGHTLGGPDAASWSFNRLDVFIRGTDGALNHRAWNGTSWQAWEWMGGNCTSDPGVVSWGPNRIDIIIRDAANGSVHRAWMGSSWSAWTGLGGIFK